MPHDSVGTQDGERCEYNQCGMDCYMSQDSVNVEDVDSYEYNQGNKGCYMP